jgi:hypothetical protein
VLSLVRDDLGLGKITGTYASERGQPPFDPTMMTALLLYSYCCGIYSSRRIAKPCRERVDFISIVALDAPDFRSVSDFRKRHLKALGDLFKQILQLCEGGLGQARACGTGWNQDQSRCVEAQGDELRAHGKARNGAGSRGGHVVRRGRGGGRRGGPAARPRPNREEMPDWVADKKRRAEKIRNAKAELEAKAAAEAKLKAEAEAAEKREPEGRRKPGPKAGPPSTEPDAKAQKNFTNPDSRIMKSKDGFVQA